MYKDGVYNIRDNGHTIGDVFYLLDNMRSILLCLNDFFQKTSYPIKDEELYAKRNAELFWQYVGRT